MEKSQLELKVEELDRRVRFLEEKLMLLASPVGMEPPPARPPTINPPQPPFEIGDPPPGTPPIITCEDNNGETNVKDQS